MPTILSSPLRCIRSLCRPYCNFLHYGGHILRVFLDVSHRREAAFNLALYALYPLLLYGLLEHFHGLCGPVKYAKKVEAIAACQTLYSYFTALLRTYKLAVIIRFHVDAADKQQPPSTTAASSSSLQRMVGTIFKCRAWMHLSHELAVVTGVAFLILFCFPVLAFWVMFLSIGVSSYNLVQLVRRLWTEAQQKHGPTERKAMQEQESLIVEEVDDLDNSDQGPRQRDDNHNP